METVIQYGERVNSSVTGWTLNSIQWVLNIICAAVVPIGSSHTVQVAAQTYNNNALKKSFLSANKMRQ